MDIRRQEIIASHLRYGTVAEPLRTRAYAQLIAKAFLLEGRDTRLSPGRIKRSVKEIVGGAELTDSEIGAGLEFLASRNVVHQRGRKWQLGRRGRKDLEEQVNRRRERISSILARHFPGDIEPSELGAWFDDACVAFFVAYGDRWVSTVTRRTPMLGAVVDLQTVVRSTAKAYTFSELTDTLAGGLKRFLQSNVPEDNEHLWHLGMATFASRLVSAGIAADPISTRELSNSTVLLDTNALLTIKLEASRHTASFEALSEALGAIDAKLYYAYPTREEYRRVVAAWSAKTLKALERYGSEVLRDSGDVWIRTAVGRYCSDRGDFERFFEEIIEPPDTLGDHLTINLIDDADLAESAEKAVRDNPLVTQIQTHWQERRRGRLKGRHVAEHDAALTGVARALTAQGTRCWILTLDLTMTDLALRWCGPTGTPLWIPLDPLLHVLAVDHAGTKADAVHFGPLLALLIRYEIEVPQDEFRIEDLRWLDEIHRDVGGMPAEMVKEMAQEIHRARLAGAKRDDPELKLTVERSYQRTKAQLVSDMDQARQIVAEAEDATDEERDTKERLAIVATQEIETRMRKRARSIFVLETAVWLGATIFITWGALAVFSRLWESGTDLELFNLIAQLAMPVLATAAAIWRVVLPRHRTRLSQIPDRAQAEMRRRANLGSGKT